MGISSDIMHDFVAKEIRAIYSSYDGWSMSERRTDTGYDRIVILERRNNGHRECAKILVTFSKDLTPEAYGELMVPEKAMDGTPTRNFFAVMVPANATTAAVPAGLPVYTMRSFAFEGKELAWVKKPVRKDEQLKAAA